MSLESIIQHILVDTDKGKEKMLQEAGLKAEEIIRRAKEEAEALYRDIVDAETVLSEKQRQRLIVNARLEAKKSLLTAKQGLIDLVFSRLRTALDKARLKKQQISQTKTEESFADIDFYLDKIRPDYETAIAGTLFKV